MRSTLIACPSCACHVHATETSCPHCGFAPLGGVALGVVTPMRAAVAVALGLAVSAAAMPGCTKSSTGTGGAATTSTTYAAQSTYGVASSTNGSSTSTNAAASTTTGATTASTTTGAGG